jgi:hypothetical protein
MPSATSNADPNYHAANVSKMLGELVDHLRDDIQQFDEPKAQALFETSAEVLLELRTAFESLSERQGARDAAVMRCLRARVKLARREQTQLSVIARQCVETWRRIIGAYPNGMGHRHKHDLTMSSLRRVLGTAANISVAASRLRSQHLPFGVRSREVERVKRRSTFDWPSVPCPDRA